MTDIVSKIAEKEAELAALKQELVDRTNLQDLEKRINALIKEATIIADARNTTFTLSLDERKMNYHPDRNAFYSDDYHPYWSSSSMSC
jgi:hypothetical protein